MDERLQKICDAHDKAGREQPSEYPALPAWRISMLSVSRGSRCGRLLRGDEVNRRVEEARRKK
jgi:hypothetical protein